MASKTEFQCAFDSVLNAIENAGIDAEECGGGHDLKVTIGGRTYYLDMSEK